MDRTPAKNEEQAGRSLLAITAHPDDESGAFGGTLALYARQGVRVDIVCLTRGEAGRHRGPAQSREQLAEIRAAEFRDACALLGAGWCEILAFPDAGLIRLPVAEPGAALCRVVRERRPDVVLTLGPEGGYTGHADHTAVSLIATFAFHAAGRDGLFADAGPIHQAARLYYVTGPERMTGYPDVCFPPITTEVDVSSTFERKLEAFKRHQTQSPLFERFEAAARHMGPREYFHLAASRRGSGAACPERGLFEGL